MASPLKTHLSLLEDAAYSFSPLTFFLLSMYEGSPYEITSRLPKTYGQFLSDVELVARHWSVQLRNQDIPLGSVVGLWLGGLKYVDLITIYGISRAGFVPQLISSQLPNSAMTFELLARSGAKALIYDSSSSEIPLNPPVPIFATVEITSIQSYQSTRLPPLRLPSSPHETSIIFHTSGSTSGSPKLVPCSYAWVDSMITKAGRARQPKRTNRQDVTTWMGSVCHIAQWFMLLGAMQHGSCIIQPSRRDFSSEELIDMVLRFRLNRLCQFGSFLNTHLNRSRSDSQVLTALKHMDEVLYTGVSISRSEEEFAYSAGIPLVNMFGSTECNGLMATAVGQSPLDRLLCPLPGMLYTFEPLTSGRGIRPLPQSQPQSPHNRLFELVVLAQSPDCPDPSLRDSDGNFHTGDIFQEIQPGYYLFRGRNDDWIKTQTGLRCNTRAIEENVLLNCPDLVRRCVVVGTGRPFPTLFVEPTPTAVSVLRAQAKDSCVDSLTHEEKENLKKEIIRRTRAFHARRYVHERITNVKFVVVVEPDTLPRTVSKGNIRPKAVEESYKDFLDSLYSQ